MLASDGVAFRVLGVDPGTTVAGYAVLEWRAGRAEVLDVGVIRSKPRQPLSERLVVLHNGIENLIAAYHPGALAIEDVFFARNARSSLKLGEARGVVIVTAAQRGLEIAEYPPAEVKRAIVGHGAASKEQVQRTVAMLLGLKEIPRPDDAADALAIALCYCHRQANALSQLSGSG